MVLFVILGAPAWSSLDYEDLLAKNPFSPERKYTPYQAADQNQGKLNVSLETYRKNLILRGTFWNGQEHEALIEIRPGLKSRLKLQKSRLILKKGDKIGDCVVEEIKRGAIVLGGVCGGEEIRLSQAPERQKPLPVKASNTPLPPKPPFHSSPAKEAKSSKSAPKNPFKAFMQKRHKNKGSSGSHQPPVNPFKALLEKRKNKP